MPDQFEPKNKTTQATAQCPNCGKSHEIQAFQRIIVPDNTTSRERLRSGHFNTFRCDCGDWESWANVAVHVIDSVRKYALFCRGRDFPRPRKSLHPVWHPPGEFVQHRLTRTRDELLEKANIFDAGLDDRLIEAVKFLRLHEAKKRGDTRIVGLTQHFFRIFPTTRGGISFFFMWSDRSGNPQFADREGPEGYQRLAEIWTTKFPPIEMEANRWIRVDRGYTCATFDIQSRN
jgi:hypothetical protein